MKSIALLAMALVFASFGLQSLTRAESPLTKLDCLAADKAGIKLEQFREPSAQAYLRKANSGHEIIVGRSAVVAFREFKDNPGVDSQVFTKVTLELPSGAFDSNADTEMNVVHSYYTSGSTGFIHRGEFWTAQDFVRKVALTRSSGGLVVTPNATFAATKAVGGDAKNVTLNYSCAVRSVNVGQLNPWEGKVGADFSSFAPN
jgi:hypothetical protein